MGGNTAELFGPIYGPLTIGIESVGMMIHGSHGLTSGALAAAIRGVVDGPDANSDLWPYLLRCIADSLDHPESSMKLEVRQPRQGRRNASEAMYRNIVNAHIAEDWFVAIRGGVLPKNALADVAKKYSISDHDAYKARRAAANYMEKRDTQFSLLGIFLTRDGPEDCRLFANWLQPFACKSASDMS